MRLLHKLFRSEPMSLYQVFIQYDIAYETTINIGEAGIVEFLDLHLLGSFHQRQFSREVELCDDIERKLDNIRRELVKENFEIQEPEDEPPPPYSTELFDIESTKKTGDERSLALFWKLEKELKNIGKNSASVKRDYLKYYEYRNVMMKTDHLFEGRMSKASNESLTRLLLDEAASSGKTVGFVGGVIVRDKVHTFQQIVWRVCQGNVFFSHEPILDKIEDPDTGIEVYKSVFFAIYQGENLEQKIMKVCEGFRANIYRCPIDMDERAAVIEEITIAMEDLDEIILEVDLQRRYILEIASENISRWTIMIWKAKAVFTTMNKFQPDKMRKVFIAEIWVPDCKFDQLYSILLKNQNDMIMKPILMKINSEETPPTYHDLNKFTRVFQDLIDAYGPNTYQEHNPAPYYIVTFPFLFSIMFGDAGHGVILTLAGVYLLWNEKSFAKKQPGGEIGRIFFAGRYVILLMGLFSIQSGLLYNDIFSRTTHFFESSWHFSIKIHHIARLANSSFFNLDPETDFSFKPYPFGLDPLWQMARNSIVFRNSLKMKMSIILGVIQMLFGLLVGINNILFFGHYLDIITVFIPQVIFLSFLFMYLSILIIIKWIMYGPGRPLHQSPGCAPSILNMFIGMVLFTDSPTPEGCHKHMYPHQPTVQMVLLACSLVCVPWLFLVKPIVDIKKKKAAARASREEGKPELGKDSADQKTHSESRRVSFGLINAPKSRSDESSGSILRGPSGEPLEPYYDFCQKFGQTAVIEAETKRRLSFAKYPALDHNLDRIEMMRSSQSSRRKSGSRSTPRSSRRYSSGIHGLASSGEVTVVHEESKKESNFDIFIHQAIHSIEFLLGTVSNTASYLRLWALSLAHEQLSHVVWKQLFGIALTSESSIQPILIVVIFLFWAVLSVAILVLMEGLSAFLHTLRLHWIEFQSKFYDGNGRNFQPFNFAEIIDQRKLAS